MRRPPRSTLTDTLVPYSTLFRSCRAHLLVHRAPLGKIIQRDRLGRKLTNGDRGAAQAEWRHDHIDAAAILQTGVGQRSEEHTSELQSLMRISYAVLRLKNKTRQTF